MLFWSKSCAFCWAIGFPIIPMWCSRIGACLDHRQTVKIYCHIRSLHTQKIISVCDERLRPDLYEWFLKILKRGVASAGLPSRLSFWRTSENHGRIWAVLFTFKNTAMFGEFLGLQAIWGRANAQNKVFKWRRISKAQWGWPKCTLWCPWLLYSHRSISISDLV
jgi:hypothetical protein